VIKLIRQNEELFDLFTRREEYNSSLLDKYQRFPHFFSRNKNILEPAVSKFLIENGLKTEYPEGKKFAVCLTHDIDIVAFSRSEVIKQLLSRRPQNALKMLYYNTNPKSNPKCNFQDIMSLEEKYGAKSSFYFLAIEEESLDFNFKIEDLEHELGNIGDNGCEVGLHGGYEAYDNLNRIKIEKERLERVLRKKVVGYRNHYLRFNIPDTWEILSKAGFKYDTTLAYPGCVGFRNGMCHPFKPFNLTKSKEIDIMEIPLTLMESTLFDYMRLDFQGSWKIAKLLIDTVEKYNGIITVLWHNTSMKGDKLKLYEKILKYCYEKNAWITSGEEIEKIQYEFTARSVNE
jgi:peptidoglycan/xylan/chitin deacetylase (PgdA/CDA1 family)